MAVQRLMQQANHCRKRPWILVKHPDAVILGAVGGPKWDSLSGSQRPEAGLLGIRGALGLYANLRPAVIFEPLRDASPLKEEIIGDALDIMVVRELTGGIYFGQRGRDTVDGVESAFDTERYSVKEVERIARIGFEMAQRETNAYAALIKPMLESSRLWRETVTKIAKRIPGCYVRLYVCRQLCNAVGA